MKVFPRAAARVQRRNTAGNVSWGSGAHLQVYRAARFYSLAETQHCHGSTKHPRTCARSLASLVFSFFAAFNGRRMNISCNAAALCNGRGMFSRPETGARAPECHFIWQWLVLRVLLISTEHHNPFSCVFPSFSCAGTVEDDRTLLRMFSTSFHAIH